MDLGIKSGTNQIHGTVYHYNRNEFFATEGPFAKAANQRKPAIRFMETGGSIGGPIVKQKTFLFSKLRASAIHFFRKPRRLKQNRLRHISAKRWRFWPQEE